VEGSSEIDVEVGVEIQGSPKKSKNEKRKKEQASPVSLICRMKKL